MMLTILSDLSEVLCHGLYGIDEIVAERYGVETSLQFRLRLQDENETFRELLRGKMSEEEYWKKVIAGGDWPFSIKEAKSMLSANMSKTIPGTLDVYRRIIAYPRKLGGESVCGRPPVILVSDHISERLAELRQLHPDIFSLVKRAYYSCSLGRIKQDPGFFPELLRKTGLSADQAILVDDMEENIGAASRSDIYGVIFQNAEQLERGLMEYGFIFAPKTE